MAEPVRRSARRERGFRPPPKRKKPTLRVRTPVRPVAVPPGVVPGAFQGFALRLLPYVFIGAAIGRELGKRLPTAPDYVQWTELVEAYHPQYYNGWDVANVCRAWDPCRVYRPGATGGCADFPLLASDPSWQCGVGLPNADPLINDFIVYTKSRPPGPGSFQYWGEVQSWSRRLPDEGYPEPLDQQVPEKKPKYAPAESPELFPGVDPMGLPLLAPVTAPALPYWLQPYRRANPNRDPLEQPRRGHDRLGRLPRVPGAQMTVHPVGPPTVAPRAPPGPPQLKEKQRKLIMAGLRKVVGLVTEGLDVLVIFHQALPAWVIRYGVRRGRPGERHAIGDRSFGERLLGDLWTYWEFIDWDKALEGLVWNQIEDLIYGKIGRQLQVDHLGRGPALRQEILREALMEMGIESGSPLSAARDAVRDMR